MIDWRERVEDLLVAEATDSLSPEQGLELEDLLQQHPQTDRYAIEFAVASVFLAAADYRPERVPNDLYARLLEEGEQLVEGSD